MSILSNYLNIQKTKILAKEDCSVIINENEYKSDNDFIEYPDHFYLPGVFELFIKSENKHIPIMVNYNVKLYKTDLIEEISPRVYLIHYQKDDLMISQDTYEKETNMTMLVNLFQGRIKHLKSPEALVDTIASMLGIDSVYIELIVSNMFRNQEGELCRYNGDYSNSTIISQNMMARKDSWLSSFSYGYIDTAIENGLVTKKEPLNTPIEKIMMGNL